MRSESLAVSRVDPVVGTFSRGTTLRSDHSRSITALALIFVVALLAQGFTAQGASAVTKKKSVRVSAHLSKPTVLAGDRARIRGYVTGTPKRGLVQLQRYSSREWRTIASTRTRTKSGAYSFTFRPATGNYGYRVKRPTTKRTRSGRSATRRLAAERCTPLSRPSASTSTQVWFNDTTKRTTSQIARKLGALFCAAAPRSTINITMYFLRSDSAETEKILKPLEVMHRNRGVKVNVLLENRRSLVSSWTRKRLARFASLRVCVSGCRNESSTPAILHQKFVTISNMSWKASTDPVVVSSSANWSREQLRDYWQNAVLVHNDPVLTREFNLRFDSMRACGTSRCRSWRAPGGRSLVNRAGIWADSNSAPRRGTAGRGNTVIFSPQPAGIDPVADSFAGMSCTPAHRTVRMAMYYMSPGRAWTAAKALAAMRDRGGSRCDIQVLTSVGGRLTALDQAIEQFARFNIPVRCVQKMHTKFTVVDATRTTDGAIRQLVLDGSANLAKATLTANDDAQLNLTVQDARGSYAAGLLQVHAAYRAQWNRLNARTVSCGRAVAAPKGATSADLEKRALVELPVR